MMSDRIEVTAVTKRETVTDRSRLGSVIAPAAFQKGLSRRRVVTVNKVAIRINGVQFISSKPYKTLSGAERAAKNLHKLLNREAM